eukprot:698372-Karenia_brevis.AAC.1
MYSPLPVHNALDNLSVVNKANYYLKHMLQYPSAPPPGKPFSLVANGDLWQIFWKIALARGPASIR